MTNELIGALTTPTLVCQEQDWTALEQKHGPRLVDIFYRQPDLVDVVCRVCARSCGFVAEGSIGGTAADEDHLGAVLKADLPIAAIDGKDRRREIEFPQSQRTSHHTIQVNQWHRRSHPTFEYIAILEVPSISTAKLMAVCARHGGFEIQLNGLMQAVQRSRETGRSTKYHPPAPVDAHSLPPAGG